MDIRLGVHFVILIFFAILAVWSVRIGLLNIRAARSGGPPKKTKPMDPQRRKRMIILFVLAGLVLGALNVLPIVLF